MIPSDLREQVAMLAHPSNKVGPTVEEALAILIKDGGYFFDMKWDGTRAIAFVEDGDVRFRNRRGEDVTYRYPDLVARLAEVFPDGSVVFDGEIVVIGKDGRPDYDAAIHRRDSQQNARSAAAMAEVHPATYMAFDLLHRNGDDYRRLPFTARRGLLATLSECFGADGVPNAPLQQSVSSKDGPVMWKFVLDTKLEGLIAKQGQAPYRGGRSSAWIKLKPIKTVTAIATGYDLGKKNQQFAHTLGAMHLTVLENGEPVGIGKVGTGFSIRQRDELKDRMDAGELLVVEVEYQEVSPVNKQLRFPSFKGLRTDQTITDCTIEQLR